MNQEHINEMINKINEKRQKSIRLIDEIIRAVIDKYTKLHQYDDEEPIDESFSSDEKNSIDIIASLSSNPNWHDLHDSVWRILLELRHSTTFKSLSQFANVNLDQLERDIDMPSMDNIRAAYEKKYLDSPKLKYDGDVLICDPSILLSEKEREECPSLYTRNTLDNNTPYYTVTGMDNHLVGTICTPSMELCTVLAKDIWTIPSANDALLRCDVNDYTFIKQFHGTIQFRIEQINNRYILQIEGDGNKPFRLNRIEGDKS